MNTVAEPLSTTARVVPIAEAVELNPRPDRGSLPDDLDVSFVPMAAVEAATGRMDATAVRPLGEVKKGYTAFREGDVLFAKITPCMENGKMAVARGLHNGIGCGSTEFHVLRPKPGVDAQYVYHFVSSARFRAEAAHHMTGAVGQKRVPAAFLEQCEIPLPDLDEQRRIVAELEKQFSRLDEAVANLKRVKANLKRQVAAVLKTAFEGGLVRTEFALASEDGREVESGRDLLRRLLDARRAALAGKRGYREPVAPIINSSHSPPNGWTWATADQLTLQITDGEHITPPRTAAGVLLLSARNVLNGRLALDDVDHISEEEHERLCHRLNVQSGDVLLSCSGSVGRSCVVPERLRFSLVRSVAVLKPNGVVPEFLSYQLRSPRCQEQIEDSKTETAQANLFQGKIRQLVFGLPPLAEQRRIVAEVDRRLSIVREVEAEVDANLKRAQVLRQAVLARAFSGLQPDGSGTTGPRAMATAGAA